MGPRDFVDAFLAGLLEAEVDEVGECASGQFPLNSCWYCLRGLWRGDCFFLPWGEAIDGVVARVPETRVDRHV